MQLVCNGPRERPVEADCMERDVACDLEMFVALGSNHGKSSRCHGQQDVPCLPLKLLANPKTRVSPCCLHIALVLVNALDDSMLRRAGEDVVQAALYGPANVTKSPYQGGTFQENECRKLFRASGTM